MKRNPGVNKEENPRSVAMRKLIEDTDKEYDRVLKECKTEL